MDRHFCLIVAIFAVILHSGTAIKCYNCASKVTPNCADPFNSGDNKLEPIECTPDILNKASKELGKAIESVSSVLGFDLLKGASAHNPPFVCQKIDTEVSGETLTFRSCQISDANIDTCEKIKSKMETGSTKVTHCSICEGDSCNGAPASIQSASMIGYLALMCMLNAMWARMTHA